MMITTLATIVLLGVLNPGQATDGGKTDIHCQIAEMMNDDGWVVPGLSGARTVNKAKPIPGIAGVLVEALKPTRIRGAMTLITCVKDQPDRVQVKVRQVDVRSIVRFSVNGKTFGYKVSAVPMGIQDSKQYPLASVEIIYYYDPDGSGKFKIARYAGDLNFKPFVPEWVKK